MENMMRACGAYTVRWRKLADFAVFWKRSNRAQYTGSIQNTLLLLRHMLYQLDNIAHSHTNTFTSMEHCMYLMVSLRTNIHNKFSFRKTTTHPTHIWFCVYKTWSCFWNLVECWYQTRFILLYHYIYQVMLLSLDWCMIHQGCRLPFTFWFSPHYIANQTSCQN